MMMMMMMHDEILQYVATATPPFAALIDTGALITGLSNEEVAAFLLQEGLVGYEGCVYLTHEGQPMVQLRGHHKPLALAESGVSPGARFTFYDQIHTTGIDIKQVAMARAAVTLGKDMTLRDLSQGVWRMRGIGRGQTAVLVTVPEIRRLITQAKQEQQQRQTASLQDILSWLVGNSMALEQMQWLQLMMQDAANVWYSEALCRIRSEDIHSLDTRRKLASAFLINTEGNIRADVAPAPTCAEHLAAAVQEHQAVLQDPSAAAVLEHIQALLTGNSSARDDTASEMVQEQEQEQEQQQENQQEQQREVEMLSLDLTLTLTLIGG